MPNKTIDQQNKEAEVKRQEQVDAVQEQRETGSLADLLINDRKNRGVLNKDAGEFSTVNDNINILSKLLQSGNMPEKSDAQKVRAFNVTRDNRIREARNLGDDANIKDEIKQDNASLEKQAQAQGITLNDLKAAMQDSRDEATQEALLDVTKELLDVTEQADTPARQAAQVPEAPISSRFS